MHRCIMNVSGPYLFDPALDGHLRMLAPEHLGRKIEVHGNHLLPGPGLF